MTELAADLAQRHCVACEGGVPALTPAQCAEFMPGLSSRWQLAADAKTIAGHFEFKNYFRTTAFVNAVAWIAIHEDHHPDITFGYKTCDIRYSTHAVDGLSENDFICAAKVDALLA